MPDKHALELAIKASWIALGAYWLWSARGTKAPRQREPGPVRFAKYWLPLLAAAALLGPGDWYDGSPLKLRWLPPDDALRLAACALVIAGVVLACSARAMLGTNWSVAVQVKRSHELVERGPYRWVRHPIYSGLLLAFLGTALFVGELRAALAFAVVAVSFWYKLRVEERWLAAEFGERYVDYMRRVKALVPGIL